MSYWEWANSSSDLGDQELGSTLTSCRRWSLEWSGIRKRTRMAWGCRRHSGSPYIWNIHLSITYHSSQQANPQLMFLTSAHQQSSSGSALLREWQLVTGSGTPLTPVAEICAHAAVVRLLRRMTNQDKIHIFLPCFYFFQFKKIKDLLKNITGIDK